jgi:8-oxo-dGTP pyrophosphatase MutT (NUDIX family)
MEVDQQDPNVAREMKNNPERHVAVVGLLDDQGNILLLCTNRFPDHWQPIGGGMDPADQTPIETLIREVKEEASLELPADAFNFELTTGYDFGSGKVHFYTAKVDAKELTKFDPSEIKCWQWVSLQDALSLPTFPATKKFLTHLQLK